MIKHLLIILVFLSISSFQHPDKNQAEYRTTDAEMIIDWDPDVRLKWSDFKAKEKTTPGFAIAASTCGFGYEGTQRGREISVRIYVRFYKRESWYNDRYELKEVLEHEQLHFDICEVYGREFYKGIVELRQKNKLTQQRLEKLYYSLTKKYEETQDLYDAETDHSTNGNKQREWNLAIKNKLQELSVYSDYKEF